MPPVRLQAEHQRKEEVHHQPGLSPGVADFSEALEISDTWSKGKQPNGHGATTFITPAKGAQADVLADTGLMKRRLDDSVHMDV